MNWYTCTVSKVGPSTEGKETTKPVIYIGLTDCAGKFTDYWFYAVDAGKREMLAVALAAINGQKQVEVYLEPPKPNNSPYTSVACLYIHAS